jgi:hypothetical protein
MSDVTKIPPDDGFDDAGDEGQQFLRIIRGLKIGFTIDSVWVDGNDENFRRISSSSPSRSAGCCRNGSIKRPTMTRRDSSRLANMSTSNNSTKHARGQNGPKT